MERRFADRVAAFDAVGETRRFITGLADRQSLRVEWVEDAQYDLYCEIPPQRGLALDLWFSVTENKVSFGQHDWFADFVLSHPVETWNRARTAFEGLITGQSRVALFYSPGRKRPFYTAVQQLKNGEWHDVSRGFGWAVPPFYRTVYRYNGQEEAGPKGIAKVSFMTLVGAIAGLWWLFS